MSVTGLGYLGLFLGCSQGFVYKELFLNLMYFTSLSSLLPENFRGFGLDEAYLTGGETELWGNKVPGAELHVG